MDEKRFEGMPDEQIVRIAQSGDEEAVEFLLEKYKYFVRSKARGYFLIGADHEDIVQEGMIGLYKAVRDYKEDRQSSFRAFAELCITRQIITAIKMATRQKHIPLNSYISLNRPVYDDDSDRTLLDTIAKSEQGNPEDMLIGREDMHLIEERLGKVLSPLEKQVLMLYMEGKSYQQISQIIGRHAKCIDNALQRVKRKVTRFLEEKEENDGK